MPIINAEEHLTFQIIIRAALLDSAEPCHSGRTVGADKQERWRSSEVHGQLLP